MRKMARCPEFVGYIRSLTGPLLMSTVHEAVLEGSRSVGREDALERWARLVRAVGENEARREVDAWLRKPYRLTMRDC